MYKKKLDENLYLLVSPNDHLQKDIFWYGHYEKEAIETLSVFIGEKSFVFDIGANIGYYSVVSAKKACKGQVYAFEPISFIRQRLNENVQINGLDNISVFPFSLSNENKILTLYIAEDSNIGMSGLFSPDNFSGRTEETQTIIFDDWFFSQNIQSADVIKIDVEGAEVKVLEGMHETIKKYRPIFLIEVIARHLSNFDGSIQKLYSIMDNHEYDPYIPVKKAVLRKALNFEENYSVFFIPRETSLEAKVKIC